MPKLKTKSGAKKRFSVTRNGKVRCSRSGKRHGMTKRSSRSNRKVNTSTLSDADARIIKQFIQA